MGGSFGAASSSAAAAAAAALSSEATSSGPLAYRVSAPGSPAAPGAAPAPPQQQQSLLRDMSRRRLGLMQLGDRGSGDGTSTSCGTGDSGSGGVGGAAAGLGGVHQQESGASDLQGAGSWPGQPAMAAAASQEASSGDEGQEGGLVQVEVRGPSPLMMMTGPGGPGGGGGRAEATEGGGGMGDVARRASGGGGGAARRLSGGVSSLHRGVRALLRFGSMSAQQGYGAADVAAAARKGQSEGGMADAGNGGGLGTVPVSRREAGSIGTFAWGGSKMTLTSLQSLRQASKALLHMPGLPRPTDSLVGGGAAPTVSSNASLGAQLAGGVGAGGAAAAAGGANGKHGKHSAKGDDLLRLAMESQQAQCVRIVVDALVGGRFSRASVMVHLYDAMQVLVHDTQHKRLCRRLLKHLPMVVSGETVFRGLLSLGLRGNVAAGSTGFRGQRGYINLAGMSGLQGTAWGCWLVFAGAQLK